MYLRENPVLQRELLVNLRTGRSFLLLAGYQLLLAAVVLIGWPADQRLDLAASPPSAKRLVDLFFLGQYVIASLMAPSFAAGAITGEKERATFEMLLASPLRPAAIVIGKMVASLTHIGMLIVASLPIIVLCLPLGGISFYEVLAAYLGLLLSVLLFGAIGVFCSSYFSRTSASLVVSYLLILPLVLVAIGTWRWLESDGGLRLQVVLLVLPAYVITAVLLLCGSAAGRLLYPPDIGSEGKEVIDPEQELRQAVGLVIHRDRFPDRLFAPPRRQTLMADGVNPVYDKELHSEIFSQGTLMLRLVIQISMLLAIPLMAWLLFFDLARCSWYAVYVIVFNMLVGPVFLAGCLSGERERQTLDLLLTSPLTAGQILIGKWLVGFRVAAVLTALLLWPMLLAALMVDSYWYNLPSLAALVMIILMVAIMNSLVATFCSAISAKTSVALLATYTLVLLIYTGPVTLSALASLLGLPGWSPAWIGWTSPFAAIAALPWDENMSRDGSVLVNVGDWGAVAGYFATSAALAVALWLAALWRLARRAIG